MTYQLPVRFELPPAIANKWQRLSNSEQAALYESFMQLDKSNEQAKLFVTGEVLSTLCRVYPTGEADYSIRARAQFSAYLCNMLNKVRAELGELVQTAAWAHASGEYYELEQRCEAGRIDIVMPRLKLIVEAKFAGEWKHALGQVLAYQFCLGNRWRSALLLLGDEHHEHQRLIEDCCKAYGVHVFWHDVSTDRECNSASQSLLKYRNLSKQATHGQHGQSNSVTKAD